MLNVVNPLALVERPASRFVSLSIATNTGPETFPWITAEPVLLWPPGLPCPLELPPLVPPPPHAASAMDSIKAINKERIFR
jgi:hypothetical protein